MTFLKIALLVLATLLIQAPLTQAGCAEVDSMTEAVAGESHLLGCISCKKREEVEASTIVDWYYMAEGSDEFEQIFHYENPLPIILHEDFEDRLEWQGTMGTADLQIGSIYIHNVTFNDTGTYRCIFHRILFLPVENQHVQVTKDVQLSVVAVANRELVAVISEIMMYVLIVTLQLWMIAVLIYCYKKIWAENEARETRRALKAKKGQESLLDKKDDCDGIFVE